MDSRCMLKDLGTTLSFILTVSSTVRSYRLHLEVRDPLFDAMTSHTAFIFQSFPQSLRSADHCAHLPIFDPKLLSLLQNI
jgi:hypothetical protein